MNNFKKINYSTINYNFLEIIENWFKSDGILQKGGLRNCIIKKLTICLRERTTNPQYGINVFIG